jgi:hypothetical protein
MCAIIVYATKMKTWMKHLWITSSFQTLCIFDILTELFVIIFIGKPWCHMLSDGWILSSTEDSMECVIPVLSFLLKCIALDNKQHHGQGQDTCKGRGGDIWCKAEQGSVVPTEGWESIVAWWEQLEQLVIYHHKCWMYAFLAGTSSWPVDCWR